MVAEGEKPGHRVTIVWSRGRLLAVVLDNQGSVTDVTDNVAKLIEHYHLEFERREWGYEAREGSA